MAERRVTLKHVSREDVSRINKWLSDDEVSESWFGRYSYGDPAHLGYHPEQINDLTDDRWDEVFENSEHRIFSIYDENRNHVGEIHVAIEESLGDGQISVLIGDRESWHMGYGRSALKQALDLCFGVYGLYRVWADIPDYNTAAQNLFEQMGFTHEGTLRQSRPHEGSRHDSVVMGMLQTEHTAVSQ
ncbi:MAG: hypothetical protein CL698_05975 [Chloroflexi bacterium]|nr:hypothetical protein [Chloroflexota bacterium]